MQIHSMFVKASFSDLSSHNSWKQFTDSSKRSLTGVNVCVLLHVRLLVEPLATVLAGVRPCVRVNEEVCGQSRGALECFTAHLALEAFFLFQDIYVKKKPVTGSVYLTYKSIFVLVLNYNKTIFYKNTSLDDWIGT